MTLLKNRKLLSLLLAMVMVVSLFSMSALAADDIPETQKGDVYIDILEWEYDADCGELYIYGSGSPATFTSAEDQPWANFRGSITTVYIDDYDGLTVANMAYWFSGCTNLKYAEVAANVYEIGADAFAGCVSLHELILLHDTRIPKIVSGAFRADRTIKWSENYDPRLQVHVSNALGAETLDAICTYDWNADNCPINASMGNSQMMAYAPAAAEISLFSVGTCSYCGFTCPYMESYEQWTSIIHCHRLWCSFCGKDQAGGALGKPHEFTHYNSSYDKCTYCDYLTVCIHFVVCNHTSTYKTWWGCNWIEYCSDCGQYINSGTNHGSTYTTRSGCNWYEYCRDCGQLVDSGVSHSYTYGNAEYYNTSRHRRLGTCISCEATTYSYGYHSTSTKYSPYNSTQHSYGSYCSTCNSYVGSVSYANHSISNGSWQSYSDSQHRKLKTCSTCGYSEYEYASHTLSYGSWSNYSATQHRRTVSCPTCGYSTTKTADHSLTYGAWTNYSASQHQRAVSCSTCGYSTYEYADHTLTSGAWTEISDTQHQRIQSCTCGYSTNETGSHTDTDNDGTCDICGYVMARFSVTVPASLSLVVSKNGEVYAAENAAIVNNSTGAVEVTAVTVTAANGWMLAPYTANMANTKVNTKLIGFSLNGAGTTGHSNTENLTFPGAQTIAKGGNLPLSYDAVVSAMSEPVLEQVLTVVFVLDWAS